MPKTKKKAFDLEINRVIDGLKTPLDAESRDFLKSALREDLEESMRPEEAVLEHIRANHEITRGYVFSEGSGDDEAMMLLQHQAVMGEDYLRGIAEEKDPPCVHYPRTTGGRHPSPIYTLPERAGHSIRAISEQIIQNPSTAQSTPQIEAAVASFMVQFAEVPSEDHKTQIADAYRASILSSTDPRMVIRRRLSRYETEDGILEIPEDQRLDRALKLLLVRLDTALAALKIIANSDLSCGDHHVVYAGGVKSPGNRIYTAQKIAKNALKDLDGYLLEPRPALNVFRELLADLTREDS